MCVCVYVRLRAGLGRVVVFVCFMLCNIFNTLFCFFFLSCVFCCVLVLCFFEFLRLFGISFYVIFCSFVCFVCFWLF